MYVHQKQTEMLGGKNYLGKNFLKRKLFSHHMAETCQRTITSDFYLTEKHFRSYSGLFPAPKSELLGIL